MLDAVLGFAVEVLVAKVTYYRIKERSFQTLLKGINRQCQSRTE